MKIDLKKKDFDLILKVLKYETNMVSNHGSDYHRDLKVLIDKLSFQYNDKTPTEETNIEQQTPTKHYYTDEELEQEVHKRVEFKLNSLQTSLENQRNRLQTSIFNAYLDPKKLRELSDQMEFFEFFMKLLQKEREMSIPWDFDWETLELQKREIRNEVLDNIIQKLRLKGIKDYHHLEEFLYNNLKKLQN